MKEVKWRALVIAVMQRLKRLLTGVNDPDAVKHENAAREEHKALVAKQRAEAMRQRKLERQRSVTPLECLIRHSSRELGAFFADLDVNLQAPHSFSADMADSLGMSDL